MNNAIILGNTRLGKNSNLAQLQEIFKIVKNKDVIIIGQVFDDTCPDNKLKTGCLSAIKHHAKSYKHFPDFPTTSKPFCSIQCSNRPISGGYYYMENMERKYLKTYINITEHLGNRLAYTHGNRNSTPDTVFFTNCDQKYIDSHTKSTSPVIIQSDIKHFTEFLSDELLNLGLPSTQLTEHLIKFIVANKTSTCKRLLFDKSEPNSRIWYFEILERNKKTTYAMTTKRKTITRYKNRKTMISRFNPVHDPLLCRSLDKSTFLDGDITDHVVFFCGIERFIIAEITYTTNAIKILTKKLAEYRDIEKTKIYLNHRENLESDISKMNLDECEDKITSLTEEIHDLINLPTDTFAGYIANMKDFLEMKDGERGFHIEQSLSKIKDAPSKLMDKIDELVSLREKFDKLSTRKQILRDAKNISTRMSNIKRAILKLKLYKEFVSTNLVGATYEYYGNFVADMLSRTLKKSFQFTLTSNKRLIISPPPPSKEILQIFNTYFPVRSIFNETKVEVDTKSVAKKYIMKVELAEETNDSDENYDIFYEGGQIKVRCSLCSRSIMKSGLARHKKTITHRKKLALHLQTQPSTE